MSERLNNYSRLKTARLVVGFATGLSIPGIAMPLSVDAQTRTPANTPDRLATQITDLGSVATALAKQIIVSIPTSTLAPVGTPTPDARGTATAIVRDALIEKRAVELRQTATIEIAKEQTATTRTQDEIIKRSVDTAIAEVRRSQPQPPTTPVRSEEGGGFPFGWLLLAGGAVGSTAFGIRNRATLWPRIQTWAQAAGHGILAAWNHGIAHVPALAGVHVRVATVVNAVRNWLHI